MSNISKVHSCTNRENEDCSCWCCPKCGKTLNARGVCTNVMCDYAVKHCVAHVGLVFNGDPNCKVGATWKERVVAGVKGNCYIDFVVEPESGLECDSCRMREHTDYLVYGNIPEETHYDEIFNAVEDSMLYGDRVIFYTGFENHCEYDMATANVIKCAAKHVRLNGGQVFHNLDLLIEFLNSKCE